MNEQIEKIYGEACITAGYLNEREFLEKFAESLIRKCAGVCLEQRQYQTKEVYAQAVLSHFGVEE
jgi:hypothetical protein